MKLRLKEPVQDREPVGLKEAVAVRVCDGLPVPTAVIDRERERETVSVVV